MDDKERMTFKARAVTVLECTAGNFDHNDGEAATIITVGRRDGKVEAIVLNLRDSRLLAVRLLASIYTANDDFAEKVLTELFPHGEDGQFHWPRTPEFGE